MGKNSLNHNVLIERYFEEISQIPRNIEDEKAISDYIVNFANDRDLWVEQDELWNILIKKPASAGYENSEPVILQAHLDMVCVKTPESTHDFFKDPIQLIVEDGRLHAKDTTLGADDGYGVAMILSVLDDENVLHPPLECIFTTQEESGTYGALFFDASTLESKRMIGLDSDSEHSIYVSSYCSDKITLDSTCERKLENANLCELKIKNMKSDAISGAIHQEYGNAIKIMARLLKRLNSCGAELKLSDYQGGEAVNFVPLECNTVFAFENLNRSEIEKEILDEVHQLKNEVGNEDFEFDLDIEFEEQEKYIASTEQSEELINLLYLLPGNTFQYDMKKDMMLSINNIGIVEFSEGLFRIESSVRSRFESAKDQLIEHWKTLASIHGFSCSTEIRYKSLPYIEKSKMRELVKDVMFEKQGVVVEEAVCQGGLEIAIFGERIPNLDIVTIGVDIDSVHTPHESMDMASFQRAYETLKETLKRMTQ